MGLDYTLLFVISVICPGRSSAVTVIFELLSAAAVVFPTFLLLTFPSTPIPCPFFPLSFLFPSFLFLSFLFLESCIYFSRP